MTFKEQSIKALEAYWRTAVVIDDVVESQNTKVALLHDPNRKYQTAQKSEDPKEFHGAPLDTHALIDAFFEKNILCTVLARKELPLDKMEALMRSDILVLDWMLDDNGEKTAHFIGNCASQNPHALHMICIYTSENDINSIKEKLETESPSLLEIKEGIYTINSTYIIVVRKSEEINPEKREADEKSLPQLLFNEFAPLVGGLLRNAVFHSINAIRHNTHALLDRFQPEIDPAFITHRVYSKPCEDTEHHIISLICSEIYSILTQEKIHKHLDAQNIKEWISINSVKNIEKCIIACGFKKNSQDCLEILKIFKIVEKEIPSIIEKGIMSVNEFNAKEVKEYYGKILKKSLLTYFWGSQDGARADAMLSMLMSHEHRYSSVEPVLKSGTMLKLEKEETYFLCIQPPCDCVRIESEGRFFIFAHVSKHGKDKIFDFSFIDSNGDKKYFAKNNKIYNASLIKFQPETGKTFISAADESGTWKFTDVDGNKYEFLFQLNELHALRAIQECGNDLSRIGLMESDWQRRCSMGEHLKKTNTEPPTKANS